MTKNKSMESTFVILGNEKQEYYSEPVVLKWNTMECAACSFQGVGYKSINEDRVIILPDLYTFSVIDGMGGPGEGHKASQFLVELLSEQPQIDETSIKNVIKSVNKRIKEECVTSGAGACFLIAKIIKDQLQIWYAGDVKLIVINQKGGISFETRDHSLVNAWIASGVLSPDNVLNHPMRNVVTKALSGDSMEVEYLETSVSPKSRIVIASDGLWDNYTIDEVTDFIDDRSPKKAVELLMEKATEKMKQQKDGTWDGIQFPKPDNISILIVDV